MRSHLTPVLVAVLSLCTAIQPAQAQRKQISPVAQTGPEIRSTLGLTGRSGWMLMDLDTNEVLDQGSADRGFAPASVAKLPTAAFALDALGPDYRFTTSLVANGSIAGGRVKGDLILKGSGDPELDTDALMPLVSRLSARGIKGVDGRFGVDASALPQTAEIEPSQAVDASYNPSVSGLNLNFNRVHLKWDARSGRNRISVEAEAEDLSPPVDGIRVALNDDPSAPLFTLRQRNGREDWLMARRAFKGAAARWLPVKNPATYAGEVFRTLSGRAGLKVPVAVPLRAPENAEELAIHQSRPLGNILRDMLRFSTNVTAEATGAAASRAVGMAVDNLRGSANVMNAWASIVAGFDINDPGFQFVNHSGLTLNSRVTPRRMVELLAALGRRAPDPGAAHSRLPGGIAGYLKRHNVAAKAVPLDYDRLEVVAKTGTMSYVRGLAGYIATPNGRRLAFAIFSNDLARRSGGAEKVNRRWMGKAKGFERSLIRNWVMKHDKAR
ncbi:MAG: D-alanyl-D-alanine carboxypeptidase/D-alanyl-D-alanine-endopeptidase [Pseudomonadota bacterium]